MHLVSFVAGALRNAGQGRGCVDTQMCIQADSALDTEGGSGPVLWLQSRQQNIKKSHIPFPLCPFRLMS